ncbi:uncharacterized protein LOC141589866 [Silene latifolia]|uniref:uncharacterized protein LOC141589866 n=1 Tax=Silene latifolia TaxID=37657 RepID=UPI003D76E3FD
MDNGEWNFDTEDIMGLFVHYYSGLFKEGVNEVSFDEYFPTVKNLFTVNKEFLSPDDSDALGIHFTPKEVRTAVFQLGPLKSPGPDGIPAIFFHKCWHFIKHEVIGTVLAILNGNSSPEFLNKTFLVLIPKSSAPETVDNFRPISLCNVIMKIVTRCITNRLKKFMGKLVGDFQNAFVPGRNIGDNILITNEILQKISSSKNGRMGRMAFKADMSKAYDRLDWNFIRGTLVLMGFPCNFIQLIMKCITTVSYEILVNGVPSRRIHPRCGLRQGDPLSPYIFVLCTEILSLNILRMEKDGLIQGIKISRKSIPISHMLFADDSMFFIEGNSKSCDNLDKVIKDYCHASGQVINDNKSSMTLSSCSSLSFARKCLKTFNIPCGTNMGSYLGIPTDVGLSGCHKKSPSISWCSRLFLSQPKGNGGLGIRRMKEFNQALLAKIGWRMIIHPDSILSKSIGAKYGLRWQDGELLFNDGKSNSSWGWKGIAWGLELIKPLLAWNISPFSDLSVWNTKWVNGRVPKPLCLELLTDPPNLSNLRIKNLISNNSCWDRRLVSTFFDETFVRDILAIPIRCSEGMDNFFWSASSSGNYSVKIGYHIALKKLWNTSATPKDHSRVPAACMGVFQKILWNLPGPKSWIILIWKILTESLPSGEGFLKRGFDGPFTCVLCDSPETETPDHLFRDCSFASRVWAGSVLGIRAQSGNNLNLQSWVCNWLSVLFKADNKQEACLSFLCTIWTIWVVRCRKGSLNCSQSLIYVDAAWSKELVAGLGGCIMFENEVVSEFCIKGSAENAEQAEALAIREALKWALSHNILHVTIFSDCLQVLAQVLKYSQLKHWTRNTVEDITELAANFHCVSFAYVPRICNKAAHRLAKRAIKL